MKKQDMIQLIETVTSINKLNDDIIRITGGYPIANDEYKGIYNVYDVIFNNSRYAGRIDDKAEDEFRAIINAINKTPEEKYELLKQ